MDGPIRSAVHALKYDGLSAIAPLLGEMLNRVPALDRVEIELVVPVPLHPARLRERGFNQAGLLASPVAASRGWRLDPTALRRTRNTPSQVSTRSEHERDLAMRGAFEATRSLDGEHVLLVDDVVTTTSTVNSAASALKAAGAGRVTILALAREL
jgi:ComF family protein